MGQRNAHIADFEGAAGELVAGARKLGRAGGPAPPEHEKGMLEGRLYPHLDAGAAHAECEKDGGGGGCSASVGDGGWPPVEPHHS